MPGPDTNQFFAIPLTLAVESRWMFSRKNAEGAGASCAFSTAASGNRTAQASNMSYLKRSGADPSPQHHRHGCCSLKRLLRFGMAHRTEDSQKDGSNMQRIEFLCRLSGTLSLSLFFPALTRWAQ
jgi:hypothetical protein